MHIFAIVIALFLAQPKGDVVIVRVETSLGNIDIAVDGEHAPVTAANFLKSIDAGLYNGGRFHRATRPDNYVPQLP
jgi:Peptidyl-prolyl cis-trans isomerase (rotamase) - cyclophilin family